MPLLEFSNLKTPIYTYPKPQVRKVAPNDSVTAEMRKWLLEGKNKIVF